MSHRVATSTADAKPALRRVAWLLFALLCAIGLLATVAATRVYGQDSGEYQTLPINAEYDTNTEAGVDPNDTQAVQAARKLASDRRKFRNADRKLARDIMGGTEPLGPNQARFDRYFKELLFPEMTLTDPAYLSNLGSLREKFFNEFTKKANNAAAQQYLVRDVTLPVMQQIIAENFHPAAKVNAMLMIGRLNLNDGGHNRSVPIPLPEALTYLVTQFNDAATPEMLKIAALYGIHRHAMLDGQLDAGRRMDAGTRDQIVAAMVPLLADAAEDADPNLHYWYQRRAIQVLGSIRAGADDGQCGQALYTRLIDSNSNLWTKCDAAQAYGMLEFASPDEVNVSEVSLKLAEIAAQAARDEIAYLDGVLEEIEYLAKWRKEGVTRTGPGSGFPTGGRGGRGGRGNQGGSNDGADDDPSGAGSGGGSGGGAAPGAGDGFPGGGGFPGSGGGGYPGMQSSTMVREQVPMYRVTLARRRLKAVVQAMQTALGRSDQDAIGMTRLSQDADTKKLLDEIRGSLDSLMTATDAGLENEGISSVEDEFKFAITNAAQNLQSIVEENTGAAGEGEATGGDAAGGADILGGN